MRCFTRLAILLLVGFLVSSCKKEAASEIQIYFTADVNGRLEPCGCFTGQFGGLTRIDTWLDYNDPANQSIRLDVGDAIKGTEDYDRIHYEYLTKGFSYLNYAAINIGAREAALSFNDLIELSAKVKAPIVSANVASETSGELVFPPYRVVEKGGQKIVVIGLLDPDTVANTLGDDLEVSAMESTLANLLPEINKSEEPDLLILLAFTGEEKMRSLAKRFYELDVILGGDVPQPSQEMIVENESVILYTTNQARAVGDLKIQLIDGQVTEPAFDIHLMKDSIPQSSVMLELSKNYREFIRNAKLEIDDPESAKDDSVIPGVGLGHEFVGSQTCGACHPTAMKVWEDSAHSHAFVTLEKGGTDADPNCIGCHTIGFGEESGYRREFGSEKLVDVGCESCHGPGSEHVKQRALGDPSKVTFHFRPLGASQCTKCHHGEFSRPFDWEKFWPIVAHGKEGESVKQ